MNGPPDLSRCLKQYKLLFHIFDPAFVIIAWAAVGQGWSGLIINRVLESIVQSSFAHLYVCVVSLGGGGGDGSTRSGGRGW